MRGENSFRVFGNLAVIDISTSAFPESHAIIDSTDLVTVLAGGGRWHPYKGARSNTLYAVRKFGPSNSRGSHRMHRIILSENEALAVDHRDGQGLDNRRSNLRPATSSQNAMNCRKNRTGTSIFKGVSFASGRNLWKAEICINRKRIFIGRFAVEEDAARAYDAKAIELFGDFAVLNFKE